MKLTEQKYTAERGKTTETYQSLTATVEMGNNRNYVTLELDFMHRWRSKEELSSYLKWAAEKILKLPA